MSLSAIKKVLGPKGYLEAPDDMAPYLREWRDRWVGQAALIARPERLEQVQEVLSLCNSAGIGVVPQGGNTGLVGGAIAMDQTQITLNLSRMNKVRQVDTEGYAMIADAGCILADLQREALEHGRLFPLSLASEGSCQLGGNIASNAGGTNVLRYGNTRQLVLGLDVVLADGSLISNLRKVGKDNTGYDLKQLFIGSEGTLGVITSASVKLFPKPVDIAVAFVGVNSVEDAVTLFTQLRAATGDLLSAFELVPHIGLEFLLQHMPDRCRTPFDAFYPWYVLLQADSATDMGLPSRVTDALASSDAVHDAVVAQNQTQAASLWALRENLSEVQKFEGGSIKNDVSVPLNRMAAFIAQATENVAAACPGIRPVVFGHIGDGNLHFNLSQPEGADKQAFLARWGELAQIVEDLAMDMGGSFSAEHGIGQLKQAEMTRYKSPQELALMRAIKQSFDPKGIMNPGKLV